MLVMRMMVSSSGSSCSDRKSRSCWRRRRIGWFRRRWIICCCGRRRGGGGGGRGRGRVVSERRWRTLSRRIRRCRCRWRYTRRGGGRCGRCGRTKIERVRVGRSGCCGYGRLSLKETRRCVIAATTRHVLLMMIHLVHLIRARVVVAICVVDRRIGRRICAVT